MGTTVCRSEGTDKARPKRAAGSRARITLGPSELDIAIANHTKGEARHLTGHEEDQR
jgi:hypothetical protein